MNYNSKCFIRIKRIIDQIKEFKKKLKEFTDSRVFPFEDFNEY